MNMNIKDNVISGNTIIYGQYTSCHFPVICGTPRGSLRLGRYGLVKLEYPQE
jgi:hypothetical protein